jgi:hypothetical protein
MPAYPGPNAFPRHHSDEAAATRLRRTIGWYATNLIGRQQSDAVLRSRQVGKAPSRASFPRRGLQTHEATARRTLPDYPPSRIRLQGVRRRKDCGACCEGLLSPPGNSSPHLTSPHACADRYSALRASHDPFAEQTLEYLTAMIGPMRSHATAGRVKDRCRRVNGPDCRRTGERSATVRKKPAKAS